MTETYTSEPRLLTQRKLWFGPLAGATAFSLAGFVDWVISSRSCFIAHGSMGPLTPADVRWMLAGITIVLFALAVSGAVVSYRHWRGVSQSTALPYAEANGTAEFIAMAGVFTSSILAVGIVWISIPLILVDACMREH